MELRGRERLSGSQDGADGSHAGPAIADAGAEAGVLAAVGRRLRRQGNRQILDTSEADAVALVAEADQEIASQIEPADIMIIEDEPITASHLEDLV